MAKVTLNSRYGSGHIRHGETAQKGLARSRRTIAERWGKSEHKPEDHTVGSKYRWGDPTVNPEGWRVVWWPDPARPDVRTPEDWRKWYTQDMFPNHPKPAILSMRIPMDMIDVDDTRFHRLPRVEGDPINTLLDRSARILDAHIHWSFWPTARGAGGWATSHG